MEKTRGTKIIAIVALCFAVAGISLAYAALNTTLRINGSATMETATWGISFDNLVYNKTGAATYTANPALEGNKTAIGEYDVTLTKPGDSAIITFDVVNSGSLDAELTDYTLGELDCTSLATEPVEADETLVCNNLKYTLTYAEPTTEDQTETEHAAGDDVALGQKLLAGETVSLKLVLEYDFQATELPSDDVEIAIDETILYFEQAADSAE